MFHQNNRMGYKNKKNHRKNGKSRCASTFTSYLTPSPFSKGCRGLIHFSTIQDSFLHNYCNWGNQDPALQYYDRKDTLQDQVFMWREKPVLAQAERARSPGGKTENYFWASSSPIFSPQHTQTTIVLTSKWRKRRAVGTQTYWGLLSWLFLLSTRAPPEVRRSASRSRHKRNRDFLSAIFF